jgi:hypothetical protein
MLQIFVLRFLVANLSMCGIGEEKVRKWQRFSCVPSTSLQHQAPVACADCQIVCSQIHGQKMTKASLEKLDASHSMGKLQVRIGNAWRRHGLHLKLILFEQV